jgi:hypothetical protein
VIILKGFFKIWEPSMKAEFTLFRVGVSGLQFFKNYSTRVFLKNTVNIFYYVWMFF